MKDCLGGGKTLCILRYSKTTAVFWAYTRSTREGLGEWEGGKETEAEGDNPCRNSRIYPRCLPQLEKTNETSPSPQMRPNSPALHAEQLRFPNQTHKDSRFAWLNSRESPTGLSQDEKNTDVTSGTHNWLVYPKSTQDEAQFPFIESIAVSHSTSYTTSVLKTFSTIQRFPETPISSL